MTTPTRRSREVRAAILSAAIGIGVLGCRLSLSPLQNRIAVGSEPFFVFVADGEDGLGDLFAARSEGGPVYPVTFTRLHETMPILAPDGTALAFLRTRQPADSADYRVVVLNLMDGAERTLFSASEGGSIRHIGWNHGGSAGHRTCRRRIRRFGSTSGLPTLQKCAPAGLEEPRPVCARSRVGRGATNRPSWPVAVTPCGGGQTPWAIIRMTIWKSVPWAEAMPAVFAYELHRSIHACRHTSPDGKRSSAGS